MKDLRQFIKTTIREFLNENSQLSDRIDNALDWMNKHNIRISDKKFQDYVDFTNNNFYKIENLIKDINNKGYVWTSDLPMFFTTTLDDLENSNINMGEINIYKQKVGIFYKYTHVFNNPYEGATDKYKIVFTNENTRNVTDEISSEELIELIEKGVIMTEYGVIGLSKESVKKFIQNL
jgi:hypothetical protein